MSDAIKHSSYDAQKATIRVTFTDGSAYEYRIPPRVWREFQRSESKGTYFVRHIRPRPAKRL